MLLWLKYNLISKFALIKRPILLWHLWSYDQEETGFNFPISTLTILTPLCPSLLNQEDNKPWGKKMDSPLNAKGSCLILANK